MPLLIVYEKLMIAYILRRLLQAIPVIFFSAMVIFILMRLAPGDPAAAQLGTDATPENIQNMRRAMGLDQPIYIQFLRWLGDVVQGNLGRSYVNKVPVATLIGQRMTATFQLALAAASLVVFIALPVGALCALHAGKRIDFLLTSLISIIISIPNFWFGILAILLFAVTLGVLPPGGWVDVTSDPGAALRALILPAITLSLNQAAVLSRYVRTSMLDILSENYVRTAHAKGMRKSAVTWKHIFPNTLIPVLTVLGIQLGRMFGGAVVVESVYAWPGLGRLLVTGISARDYPVVQGTLLLMAIVFIVINLATDVAYGIVDPRIRLSEKG